MNNDEPTFTLIAYHIAPLVCMLFGVLCLLTDGAKSFGVFLIGLGLGVCIGRDK